MNTAGKIQSNLNYPADYEDSGLFKYSALMREAQKIAKLYGYREDGYYHEGDDLAIHFKGETLIDKDTLYDINSEWESLVNNFGEVNFYPNEENPSESSSLVFYYFVYSHLLIEREARDDEVNSSKNTKSVKSNSFNSNEDFLEWFNKSTDEDMDFKPSTEMSVFVEGEEFSSPQEAKDIIDELLDVELDESENKVLDEALVDNPIVEDILIEDDSITITFTEDVINQDYHRFKKIDIDQYMLFSEKNLNINIEGKIINFSGSNSNSESDFLYRAILNQSYQEYQKQGHPLLSDSLEPLRNIIKYNLLKRYSSIFRDCNTPIRCESEDEHLKDKAVNEFMNTHNEYPDSSDDWQEVAQIMGRMKEEAGVVTSDNNEPATQEEITEEPAFFEGTLTEEIPDEENSLVSWINQSAYHGFLFEESYNEFMSFKQRIPSTKNDFNYLVFKSSLKLNDFKKNPRRDFIVESNFINLYWHNIILSRYFLGKEGQVKGIFSHWKNKSPDHTIAWMEAENKFKLLNNQEPETSRDWAVVTSTAKKYIDRVVETNSVVSMPNIAHLGIIEESKKLQTSLYQVIGVNKDESGKKHEYIIDCVRTKSEADMYEPMYKNQYSEGIIIKEHKHFGFGLDLMEELVSSFDIRKSLVSKKRQVLSQLSLSLLGDSKFKVISSILSFVKYLNKPLMKKLVNNYSIVMSRVLKNLLGSNIKSFLTLRDYPLINRRVVSGLFINNSFTLHTEEDFDVTQADTFTKWLNKNSDSFVSQYVDKFTRLTGKTHPTTTEEFISILKSAGSLISEDLETSFRILPLGEVEAEKLESTFYSDNFLRVYNYNLHSLMSAKAFIRTEADLKDSKKETIGWWLASTDENVAFNTLDSWQSWNDGALPSTSDELVRFLLLGNSHLFGNEELLNIFKELPDGSSWGEGQSVIDAFSNSSIEEDEDDDKDDVGFKELAVAQCEKIRKSNFNDRLVEYQDTYKIAFQSDTSREVKSRALRIFGSTALRSYYRATNSAYKWDTPMSELSDNLQYVMGVYYDLEAISQTVDFDDFQKALDKKRVKKLTQEEADYLEDANWHTLLRYLGKMGLASSLKKHNLKNSIEGYIGGFKIIKSSSFKVGTLPDAMVKNFQEKSFEDYSSARRYLLDSIQSYIKYIKTNTNKFSDPHSLQARLELEEEFWSKQAEGIRSNKNNIKSHEKKTCGSCIHRDPEDGQCFVDSYGLKVDADDEDICDYYNGESDWIKKRFPRDNSNSTSSGKSYRVIGIKNNKKIVITQSKNKDLVNRVASKHRSSGIYSEVIIESGNEVTKYNGGNTQTDLSNLEGYLSWLQIFIGDIHNGLYRMKPRDRTVGFKQVLNFLDEMYKKTMDIVNRYGNESNQGELGQIVRLIKNAKSSITNFFEDPIDDEATYSDVFSYLSKILEIAESLGE